MYPFTAIKRDFCIRLSHSSDNESMSHGDLQNSREVELLEIIRRQQVKMAGLLERIALLEAELAKAKKNSSTSSKPPSSDIVKPKRRKKSDDKKKRKRGGQPGHSMHERSPFSDDQVDQIHFHTLDVCPDCGGRLQPGDTAPRVIQQIEIIEKPLHIDEHRGQAHWCHRCQATRSRCDHRRLGLHLDTRLRADSFTPLPDVVSKSGR